MRNSYTSVEELRLAGLLSSAELGRLQPIAKHYSIRVGRYYASLIDPRDPACPIRLQALPGLGEEDPALPDWARETSLELYGREVPWSADAIGDLRKLAATRLTHRYGNRAILHLSTTCAVNCRFCFRKAHLNASEEALYGGPVDEALSYLRSTPTISELILTGGDPLSLGNEALGRLIDRVAEIPSVKVLRIHSRMAVTLPARLDDGLARTLLARQGRPRASLVSHFNHPRELTAEAREGLERMLDAGVSLYNQSVLLRGVNDSTECLVELFQTLYEWGVTPYYLHHPDWTPGTFHFRVSIERGQGIANELRGRVSGPALPRYVLDVPQGYGKVSLLETGVRKLKEWCSPGNMGGALYELELPRTLENSGERRTQRYLDLHPLL